MTLFSAAAAANKTGAAINPARALGPTFVFQCNWNNVWVYVLAELAGIISARVSGIGGDAAEGVDEGLS